MAPKHFTLNEICQSLGIDAARIRGWAEHDLIVPSQEGGQDYFVDEDVERISIIRNLVDDLEVNLEGVEVILGMRDRMISMEKWIRNVFTLLDDHDLLTDDLIHEFREFSPEGR